MYVYINGSFFGSHVGAVTCSFSNFPCWRKGW